MLAYEDVPDTARAAIPEQITERETGRIVLVFGNTPEKWTAICTRMAASLNDDAIHHINFTEIEDFAPAKPRIEKQLMEYVDVALRDTSMVQLWEPQGDRFFGMWCIMLMWLRMNPSTGKPHSSVAS